MLILAAAVVILAASVLGLMAGLFVGDWVEDRLYYATMLGFDGITTLAAASMLLTIVSFWGGGLAVAVWILS